MQFLISAKDDVYKRFLAHLDAILKDGKADVSVKKWRSNRSLAQNRVFHMWAHDVAEATGEAKHGGRLKLQYFAPILLREDEAWAWVWKQTGARLSYEKQIEFLGLPNMLGCTSRCTVAQFGEALDDLWRGEAHLGLRDPSWLGFDFDYLKS